MRGKLTEKVILLQKNTGALLIMGGKLTSKGHIKYNGDRNFMRGLNKYKFNGTCVWTL